MLLFIDKYLDVRGVFRDSWRTHAIFSFHFSKNSEIPHMYLNIYKHMNFNDIVMALMEPFDCKSLDAGREKETV